MLHRVIFGSIERFIGILIEHYAGAFPVWLSPVQVKILPISEKQHDYARKVEEEMKAKGIRVKLDDRSEKVGYKIREAQLEKVPYMVIVGQKEEEENILSVRSRKDGDIGQMRLAEFMEKIKALWKKFKGIKNYEIILALVIIAIAVIIYSIVSTAGTKQTATESDPEERLEQILSEVEGAGAVEVMITYAGTGSKIAATETDTKTTSTDAGGTKTTTVTTTTSPVMQGSEVLILGEKEPEVVGVLVVAEGADDVKVRLRLRDAVATVLGIKSSAIQILSRRDV